MAKDKMEKRTLRVYRFENGKKTLLAKPPVEISEHSSRYYDDLRELMKTALLSVDIAVPDVDLYEYTKRVYTKGAVLSSYDSKGATGAQTGRLSTVIGGFDDADTAPADGYGYDCYKAGFALAVGQKVYNALGCAFDGYFYKFTSKAMRTGSAYGCKTGTAKEFVRLLKKYEKDFAFMVGKYGYHFSLVPTCEYALQDYQEALSVMTEKKRAQAAADMEEAETLLGKINAGETTAVKHPRYADTPEEEASRRLKELVTYKPVVTDYEKDKKLYMSMAGGIVYDLDDEAKKGIEYAKKLGLIPYHVVASPEGTYSVLYVGSRESWDTEVRDPKTGYLDACVWMPDSQDAEIGLIGVQSANGGLVRTA